MFRRFISRLAETKAWAARTFLRPPDVIVFSWPVTELSAASITGRAWDDSSGMYERRDTLPERDGRRAAAQ